MQNCFTVQKEYIIIFRAHADGKWPWDKNWPIFNFTNLWLCQHTERKADRSTDRVSSFFIYFLFLRCPVHAQGHSPTTVGGLNIRKTSRGEIKKTEKLVLQEHQLLTQMSSKHGGKTDSGTSRTGETETESNSQSGCSLYLFDSKSSKMLNIPLI